MSPRLHRLCEALRAGALHAQYWGIMSLPYLTYPPVLSTYYYYATQALIGQSTTGSV